MSSLNRDGRYRAEERQGSHGGQYMPCCVVVSRVNMGPEALHKRATRTNHERPCAYRKAVMAALIGQERTWHIAARCGVASLACDIPVHITALASLDSTSLRSSYFLHSNPSASVIDTNHPSAPTHARCYFLSCDDKPFLAVAPRIGQYLVHSV